MVTGQNIANAVQETGKVGWGVVVLLIILQLLGFVAYGMARIVFNTVKEDVIELKEEIRSSVSELKEWINNVQVEFRSHKDRDCKKHGERLAALESKVYNGTNNK